MRSMSILMIGGGLLFAAVLALSRLNPYHEGVVQMRRSMASTTEELSEQRRDLLLRVQLLEYQNFMLLGLINDSGLAPDMSEYNLSLPPAKDFDLAIDRGEFQNVHTAYMHFPDAFRGPLYQPEAMPLANNLYYRNTKPTMGGFTSSLQFRRDWQLVSTLQAAIAKKDRLP